MAAKQRGKKHWVGFDLGGTKMLAALFDADYKILATERKKTKALEGKAAGLERIQKAIRKVLEAGGVRPSQLGGIGIGSPGPLDLNKGVILQTPNLGWKNVPLRKYLQDAFDCPVVLANDVDVGTYGEYRFGAGRKGRCVVGVFPGTGIGGGCIYNGHILRGRRLSCVEIGHTKVLADGPLCGCGRRGCLETVASRLAISAEAAKAVYRGEAPHLASLAGTDLANIRSGVLAESVAEGDRVVETLLRRAGRYLGTAVANVVNLLAPDVVVLGGGLVEAMPDLILDECRGAAEAEVMESFRGTFRVAAAELGDNAGVLGAAALAAEPEALT